MKLGITGTREGMTPEQRTKFELLLKKLSPTEFHHGDCIGVDAQAAEIVAAMFPGIRIYVHPPIDDTYRAYMPGTVLEPRTHFARNRQIVDSVDYLPGIPLKKRSPEEYTTGMGGTFYTINYAIKRGKPATAIWPDGSTDDWIDGRRVLPAPR